MHRVQFHSYLAQLYYAASALNVDLKEAVVSAGLGDCTYYRWVNNTTTPNESKARIVFDQIKEMGGQRVLECVRRGA